MIQHIQLLEEYLNKNAINEMNDDNLEREDAQINEGIIEEIAKCEQVAGRHTSLIKNLQVYDHRTGKEIAKLTSSDSTMDR